MVILIGITNIRSLGIRQNVSYFSKYFTEYFYFVLGNVNFDYLVYQIPKYPLIPGSEVTLLNQNYSE